ncbi:integrin alpha-6 isoform X2 [Archocentrus centrarchus]|uniref:integrin alpha-6 isoform X2 n=1 Tax=Archocentrus centrarchus TaxID=63155 RepID=UPI0011E9C000|nr:integrin alpha-6 isoform X2 [Archocentrus centrarchus]
MLLQGGRSAAQAALIFSVYILESTLVLAFNLDTKQVLRKDGEPGSLFGFSLAMHRQLNPDKVMVLVGAPRARALSNQAAKITGGLYKCEVTQSNDCERIEFDNEVNPRSENKENQWMGVTVQSQGPGGKIVTCAHRYQKRWNVNTPQESHYIPGRCYILSQDLTINPGSEDGGNWKFCDGRNEDHEGFGTCQQGVAATFTKDYHYMVFGAPGAYNWKGVVRVEQDNSTLLDMGIFDDGPFEVGDERTRNPDLVPVPANSYLGFSLDSGHYITSVNLTVVAGAPRTNHSGAVVLFKKDTVAHNRLSMEHILQGPGLGSCFGYDVAVVDLNSDGWQDIVVGAPQFYMKGGDIGGAVYVYINKAGVWEGITPVRLNGTKDSMFGVAVENIGDINQDSYKDIAIGAPHADSGIGKVYIYHGSAQGIRTTQAQVLSGKDHNIRLFGYSLAGNMDLDGNSYPDLAVGSLSDSALIYRARPVISLSRVVKVSPNEIRLTNKTCGDGVCFAVTACFSYKANPASYNPKLTINYFVEMDRAHGRGLTSRVMFLNESSSESEYQFNGTLNLKEQNQQKCITQTARLKDNIKDKMHSIPIEVSAEISPKQGKAKNGLPPLMPILDATQPSKGIAEVNFLKEGCGRDHICRSNLKMEYSLYYRQPNQDVYLPLNKSKNNIPEFIVNYEKKDLAVSVTVSNMNGDDAYEAKLVGSFPNTLSYSGVRSDQTTMEKPVTCHVNVSSSQADCELGNPFKRNSKATFKVILSATNLTLDTTEIEIDLQLSTTSDQDAIHVKVKCKVIIELSLSASGEANPSQVFFGGVVRGESAMKSEEEIGSLINFTFTIDNSWKPLKPPFGASLHIHWPKVKKNGKWLLYLVSITSQGPEKIHCSPESEINPLSITQSSVSRTKREILRKERATGGKNSPSDRSILSCEDGMKGCVVLKCPLQGLDGTVVTLRSRLWNSTFIEEYASHSVLHLSVNATLVLNTQRENVILGSPHMIARVQVFPDSEVAKNQGVPWWIILVAVLIGALILALLVYLLWKCGFFKRSKEDDSIPRYHAVRIRKETPEYKDGKMIYDPFEKKQWMTTWMDDESYS